MVGWMARRMDVVHYCTLPLKMVDALQTKLCAGWLAVGSIGSNVSKMIMRFVLCFFFYQTPAAAVTASVDDDDGFSFRLPLFVNELCVTVCAYMFVIHMYMCAYVCLILFCNGILEIVLNTFPLKPKKSKN